MPTTPRTITEADRATAAQIGVIPLLGKIDLFPPRLRAEPEAFLFNPGEQLIEKG
jgi:hypothetical protein